MGDNCLPLYPVIHYATRRHQAPLLPLWPQFEMHRRTTRACPLYGLLVGLVILSSLLVVRGNSLLSVVPCIEWLRV